MKTSLQTDTADRSDAVEYALLGIAAAISALKDKP